MHDSCERRHGSSEQRSEGVHNTLQVGLEVVTNLQEDPTLQRLEMEARELQQRYDEVKATVRTIALTKEANKNVGGKGAKGIGGCNEVQRECPQG